MKTVIQKGIAGLGNRFQVLGYCFDLSIKHKAQLLVDWRDSSWNDDFSYYFNSDMTKDYPPILLEFPNIKPEWWGEEKRFRRIHIHIGDQTDRVFLNTLKPEYDLIIDDGSHVNEWTVETFLYLFPRLKKGGIYILEDMQCSYQDLEQVNARGKWSGMNLVPEIPHQFRVVIDELIARLSHRVDAGEIEAVHIHKNFILVVK